MEFVFFSWCCTWLYVKLGDIEEFPALDPIPVYPVNIDPNTNEVKVTIKANNGTNNQVTQKPLCKASQDSNEIVLIIGSGNLCCLIFIYVIKYDFSVIWTSLIDLNKFLKNKVLLVIVVLRLLGKKDSREKWLLWPKMNLSLTTVQSWVRRWIWRQNFCLWDQMSIIW